MAMEIIEFPLRTPPGVDLAEDPRRRATAWWAAQVARAGLDHEAVARALNRALALTHITAGHVELWCAGVAYPPLHYAQAMADVTQATGLLGAGS